MCTIDGLKKIPFMQVISKLEISVARTNNRLLIVLCLFIRNRRLRHAPADTASVAGTNFDGYSVTNRRPSPLPAGVCAEGCTSRAARAYSRLEEADVIA